MAPRWGRICMRISLICNILIGSKLYVIHVLYVLIMRSCLWLWLQFQLKMSQLGLLDKTRGKILMGGHINEEVLKVEPTVVLVKEEDVLLESETFGLILTIVDLEEEGFVRKACD
ncbi:hypothetical protein GYMLUDRAFT_377650 [Collybiopsis luxurians FD-317 M1]|uniref:Unplaced genomic scaffold GYMLUscaffold_107, whole genome shotgun sequence n=1 Tax=Collybiopsis luxurians FD-317 M1 TaxID=944289 RepID=A0A0D0BBM2_9AGAR|nr:hypothetical protein GYMLUDRAFT_377650 [Collybiopsis luxurians FD-317 M1]